MKFYAVIDPYDTIPEMHDEADLINNNIGLPAPASWARDFGEGATSFEQHPSYIYLGERGLPCHLDR
ncbi:MAG: hypothetical protein BroJett011_71020 [Chloroflexota bacterium]|nr:MAG: hypothetical protein BroJett011_71020 [Chloroflexota bacterium]